MFILNNEKDYETLCYTDDKLPTLIEHLQLIKSKCGDLNKVTVLFLDDEVLERDKISHCSFLEILSLENDYHDVIMNGQIFI